MDAIDKRILDMLQKNAREPFAKIGKDVNLSAPAVGKRVKQLEDSGVIKGYRLDVNHEKLGVTTKAYIYLKIHQTSTVQTAQNQILLIDAVERCDRITGEDNLCILGYFKNNKHLIDFLDRISHYGIPKTNIILEP